MNINYENENLKLKALLIAVLDEENELNPNYDFEEDIRELKNLCESCDIEVIETVTQKLQYINQKTYVGSGKIEEIKMILNSSVYEDGFDLVVCNNELSPSQIENLEKALEITIFDRTYVILDIFKKRAKTKEALLQVEIASLKYTLPRLAGLRKGLSRQSGGRKPDENRHRFWTDAHSHRGRIEERSCSQSSPEW